MKNLVKSIVIVMMVAFGAACSNGAQIALAKQKAQSDATTAGTSATSAETAAAQAKAAADKADAVRGSGLGGEIVERVVEKNARTFGDEAETVVEVQRIGIGDGIACRVNHGKMRRIAARRCFARCRHRPRMAGVDRNVLRLGAFELLYQPGTPASVAGRRRVVAR